MMYYEQNQNEEPTAIFRDLEAGQVEEEFDFEAYIQYGNGAYIRPENEEEDLINNREIRPPKLPYVTLEYQLIRLSEYFDYETLRYRITGVLNDEQFKDWVITYNEAHCYWILDFEDHNRMNQRMTDILRLKIKISVFEDVRNGRFVIEVNALQREGIMRLTAPFYQKIKLALTGDLEV